MERPRDAFRAPTKATLIFGASVARWMGDA
jgi:hypothetical protein